jgi:hypothetical protein
MRFPTRKAGAVVFALGLLSAMPSIAGSRAALHPDIPAPSGNPAVYRIEAGLDGEIYPFLVHYASLQKQNQRRMGVVTVTITNPTGSALRQRVSVQLLGWSDVEVQTVDVLPGAPLTLLFAPSFLPRFYQNREIAAATAHVSITDLSGRSVYETTVPVRLRSGEDIYWGMDFANAAFIASWVTPHDPAVEAVLARAKDYTPDHRLPGYEDWKNASGQERETYLEAEAIFTALKQSGFSYVKSSQTLGDHQDLSERIRLPRVSLRDSSANCIDAAVVYASLFENLGMDAEVILVPGHAYVGVRVAQGSSRSLLIDAALTGRATFAAAVASAQAGMAKQQPSSVTRVEIAKARSAGIYPLP